MKKIILHSGVALVMVILGITVMAYMVGDGITSAVTTVRLYTMLLDLPMGQNWVALDEKNGMATNSNPNTPTMGQLWNSFWPNPSCAAMTNLTTDSNCLATRQKLQTAILSITNCASNRSQACQLIGSFTTALAYASTYNVLVNGVNVSYAYTAGRRLTPSTTDDPLSYMQRAIRNVPLLLHNAYRTSMLDGFAYSVPAMYLLIVLFVALNVWSELLVALGIEDFVLSCAPSLHVTTVSNFIPAFTILLVYCCVYRAAANLIAIIFVPTMVILVWYFMMLPRLKMRPFIRPATFCVVYAVLTLLALGSNGVRRYDLVVVELLKAMGMGLTYMGLCWYYLGLWEKLQSNEAVAPLYSTREAHTSVLLSWFVMAAVPFFTWLAPYNYSYNSPITLSHPVTFTALSILSLLALNTQATHQHASSPTRREDLVSFLSSLLLLYTLMVCARGSMDFINVYLADARTSTLPMGPNYIQYSFNQPTLGAGLPPS